MHWMPAYSTLFGLAIKSSALICVSFGLARLSRGKSAALRHLIWTVMFGGLLFLPLLGLALPAFRIPLRGAAELSTLVFRGSVVDAVKPGISGTGMGEGLGKLREMTDWRLILVLGWLGGAMLGAAQWAAAWVRLERLKRSARRLTYEEFTVLAARLRIQARVCLLESPSGSMPMTCGLWRASIFLPVDARGWGVERRLMVMMHELAHVIRKDAATQMMARAAMILYWWNPLVWLAWREFLTEREQATDDMVLNMGAEAVDYAQGLLDIARSLGRPELTGWPEVAMASRLQLEGRLEAILDSRRDRKSPRLGVAALILICGACVIAPLAAMKTTARGEQQPGSGNGGNALLQRGDEARDQGKNDEAKALYTKLLTASGSGSDAAVALIRRGTVELGTKDFPAAIGDFEQAEKDDFSKAGECRMWIAVGQEKQGNIAEAKRLFESSLAATEPHSLAAANTLELYAQMLQEHFDQGEAGKLRQQAFEIRAAQASPSGLNLAPAGRVYRAGGNVHSPVLVTKVEPEYTAEARVAGYMGTALLSVVIGSDGTPQDIRVVQGLGFGLDAKAIEAVRQWRFKPGMSDGQAVPVRATIEVNFRVY